MFLVSKMPLRPLTDSVYLFNPHTTASKISLTTGLFPRPSAVLDMRQESPLSEKPTSVGTADTRHPLGNGIIVVPACALFLPICWMANTQAAGAGGRGDGKGLWL